MLTLLKYLPLNFRHLYIVKSFVIVVVIMIGSEVAFFTQAVRL